MSVDAGPRADERAVSGGPRTARDGVAWAFPRGRPQLFARTPAELSQAVLIYAFGRRLPFGVQRAIATLVRVPLLRSLVAERRALIEPVCGWDTVDAVTARLQPDRPARAPGWIHLRSQWEKQRCSMIRLSAEGAPELFVTIEREGRSTVEPARQMPSYRVPRCVDSFTVGPWIVRRYELLPARHQPAACDVARIRRIAADASVALNGTLQRPPGLPAHWQAIHGDLVPWNLREGAGGVLWLLDWEDATWGPPLADVVRYLVARESLGGDDCGRMAATVRASLPDVSREQLREAATFWLKHRNFLAVRTSDRPPLAAPKDAGRWTRETAAFRALAEPDAPPAGTRPDSHPQS